MAAARPQIARGLSEHEAQWEALFQAVPVGILVLDSAAPLEFVAFNDRVAELLGYSREEFARLDLADIDADRSADTLRARAASVACTPTGTRFELAMRHRCKDGSLRDLLATVLRVDQDGRRLVYSATVDVTERLQAERALREADRRKDEFLATLAHELRNPLAPLRTGLHAIARMDIDARCQGLVELCERQVRHMSRLVDDLLEVSRITRGVIELRPQRILLQQAICSAAEAMGAALDERRQRIELDLPRLALWVSVDPIRFAQVMENLLTNASKYSEPGSLVTVRAIARATEVVVEVCDAGKGIAPEDLERVFEMFVQIDPGIERSRGGLGIGLALVRRLVERHGGTVRATSPGLGCGSTFSVVLPRLETASPRP